jgi:hypothetical protein
MKKNIVRNYFYSPLPVRESLPELKAETLVKKEQRKDMNKKLIFLIDATIIRN